MNTEKASIAWSQPKACGKTPKALLTYLMVFFGLSIFPADSYLPSLPFIQKHFAMADSTVQSSVTAFLLAMGLGSLLFGPIAHRIGRKPTLLLAALTFIAGCALCLYAPSSLFFLIGRLIQGLGATGLLTLGRTIIRDVFEGAEVATISGYTMPLVSIVIAAAPIVGGYFQLWYNWQGIFYFSMIAYFLMTLFVFFDFPETRPTHHENNVTYLQAYLTLLRSVPFVCFITCVGLSMGFIMVYQTMSPLLYQTMLGLSPVEFGWLGLVSCTSMWLVAWINHHGIKRFGSEKLIYTGSALLLGAAFSALIPGLMGYFNVLVIVIPFMIGLLGATLTFSNVFSQAMQPWPHLASFAAAIYSAWQYIVSGGTSLIAAFIPESNQVPMALLWLAIALLQCFFARHAYRTQRDHAS